MAKVPKQKRIKRATVLIKRSHCVRNPKVKSHSPLYQKLKVNNHSLARALSQEKQENQLLFTRNIELMDDIQKLAIACNSRDRVISNILKNSKDMMQMIVAMSGCLTNTISSCQEIFSNQVTTHRASSSSSGRRDSNKRLSTKSPAKGVVKPMVSGYTITKPTINLSRVNMQRLPNTNLSIIQEGPATPEGNIERSPQENRRSRTRNRLPERIPVSAIRDEGSDDEENVMERINRRTSRFSQGRLSSGRYSKRNSGRLSGGGGIAGRLSKRSSDHSELIKSPRVTLQDVSRYLTNNQTINVRLLSESTNGSQANNATSVEDTQMNGSLFSPEFPSQRTIIPETQESAQEMTTTNSSSDSDVTENTTVCGRKQNLTVNNSAKLNKRKSRKSKSLSSRTLETQMVDALEGTSWMYDSETMETEDAPHNTTTSIINKNDRLGDQIEENEDREQGSSPVSSLTTQRRRSSGFFRVPDLPRNLGKPGNSRFNVYDSDGSPNGNVASTSNSIGATCSFLNRDDEDDDDDDDDDVEEQRINALRFITQRRGASGKMGSSSSSGRRNNMNSIKDEDDEDDDDETLMLNIQRQIKQTSQQSSEQPERLQFDMNELLQLTPLKPLLNMNSKTNNGPVIQVDIEPEPTATIQITQKIPRPAENTETFNRISTVKIDLPDLPTVSAVRGHEANLDTQNKRYSEASAARLSTRIELPRITDIMDITEENHQETQMISTPENNKQQETQKRKRIVPKQDEEIMKQSDSEDDDKELRVQKKKKPRQLKKKSSKTKDPSSAKVVLQKLNETSPNSPQSHDKRNSGELSTSARCSLISRAEQLSDSDSSNASSSSRQVASRPRRQKAPKNLKEHGLRKKLRRDI